MVGLIPCRYGVAAPVDVVNVDFGSMIAQAAKERNRFALEVPHQLTVDRAGKWVVSGGVATWTYAVQVPTAVSLSFHAPRVVLPAGATLTVTSKSRTYLYRARDIHRGGLWSRVAPGDWLQFDIRVPAAAKSGVVLNVSSFQAGFRSLGPGVPDHPYYARLKAQGSAASTQSCVQNYECGVTANNTGPAHSTVALVIANLYQCSGTLLNDVPGDQTPYVLTARHCESGKLGGGNPGVAADVVVYWDATTPVRTNPGFDL